ncbi:MAG: hypothetical protein OEZ39_16970 [Gammaproteobacteria bacterium]|nr:hypothetical protein [Gammaproteobacteria bacterium]MDH5653554.1 hypothetical protein [Gammaproteobacteria bacterium]
MPTQTTTDPRRPAAGLCPRLAGLVDDLLQTEQRLLQLLTRLCREAGEQDIDLIRCLLQQLTRLQSQNQQMGLQLTALVLELTEVDEG